MYVLWCLKFDKKLLVHHNWTASLLLLSFLKKDGPFPSLLKLSSLSFKIPIFFPKKLTWKHEGLHHSSFLPKEFPVEGFDSSCSHFSRDPIFIYVDTRIELGLLFSSVHISQYYNNLCDQVHSLQSRAGSGNLFFGFWTRVRCQDSGFGFSLVVSKGSRVYRVPDFLPPYSSLV